MARIYEDPEGDARTEVIIPDQLSGFLNRKRNRAVSDYFEESSSGLHEFIQDNQTKEEH